MANFFLFHLSGCVSGGGEGSLYSSVGIVSMLLVMKMWYCSIPVRSNVFFSFPKHSDQL